MYITQAGAVNENFFVPVVLSQQCCLALNSGYTFDIDAQQCRWAPSNVCSIENTFKIVLNPTGNDGSIFYVDSNENCSLNVDFNFLFKIDCATLSDFLTTSGSTSQVSQEIIFLETEIENQIAECESLTNQLVILNSQLSATPYSISCIVNVSPPVIGSGQFHGLETSGSTFSNSGFGGDTGNTVSFSGTVRSNSSGPAIINVLDKTFCLTSDGLVAWSNIIGSSNFQAFLNGDQTSYDCGDVETIYSLNESLFSGNSLATPYITDCNTPVGSRTNLLNQISATTQQQQDCSSLLLTLQAQLNTIQANAASEGISLCVRPIDMFEQLSASMTIDVVTSANTLETVYQDDSLFPPIGLGNLYSYLMSHPNSGFYVCGGPSCTPLSLNLTNNQANDTSCSLVLGDLVNDLYLESGLMGQPNGLSAFTSNLPNSAFTSNWLHFSTTITGSTILSQITDKKIKLSLKLNHTCGPICIYLDDIQLNKNCSSTKETNIFVTQCPGFELEKIRDNKKSWSGNTQPVNRTFGITDVFGNNLIRETAYEVDDDRLILNSKEIDLDMNLASGIETDVWGYITNNPCLLTGITMCDPCGYKQFQDGIFFEFMDGQYYDFEDQTFGGNEQSTCCGDNFIDFNALMTQPLSSVTVVEDFEYFLTSELIDAKNRKTISGYATLRALYDRYLNSYGFCGNYSAGFNYMTMSQFATLVGNYWVDIVEQVIPSTTIWGSVKVYSNTIFDQQKFKYRSYTSNFCGNPFYKEIITSPIYGISGVCVNVDVSLTTINIPVTTGTTITIPPAPTTCNAVCIAQMNAGSEFVGTVAIVAGRNPIPNGQTNPPTVNENGLQASVVVSGLTTYIVLVGATAPITYMWSNGDPNSTTTYMSAGDYYVTITDAAGNSATVDFTVT